MLDCRFRFIRRGWNIFSYECPCCGAAGEVEVKSNDLRVFSHGDCAVMFKQEMPTGIFAKPTLQIIPLQRGGRA